MATLITSGVEYAQMLDDVRALIRYELSAAPVPPVHNTPPADELLSIRKAAEMLGVTVQTVHEHKRMGRLAYHKLGSRSYIKRSDVMAALQGHQRSEKPGNGGAVRKQKGR